MSNDFTSKLASDLEKSGFGSELAALRVFHSEAFRTEGGKVYFDKTLNSQRALDIYAEKAAIDSIGNSICEEIIIVAAEVKKSEKPWVVLKSGTYENPYNIYLTDTLTEGWNVRDENKIREALSEHFLSSRENWFGHGVHEAFKKPDALGRWFQAASSVCRASWSAKGDHKTSQENLAQFILRQPLVILDGLLFCATSNSDFQLDLSEITKATLLYQETNASFNRRFLVDLVVLQSLPSYVAELNSRLAVLKDQVVAQVRANPLVP